MKFRIEPGKLKGFSIGIIAMGLVSLIIAWVMISDDVSFRENAEETTAVVTEIDISFHRSRFGKKSIRRSVYAQYTVDGVTYNERLTGYYNGMSEGQEIIVIYNPENPSSVRGENYKTAGEDFLPLSVVVILVGGVLALVAFRTGGSPSEGFDLKSGTPVIAEVISVSLDNSRKIKGRHPYMALCEARNEATGERFLYCSDSVEENIARLKGQKVIVYVNPLDKEKYYVDLASAYDGGSGGGNKEQA